MFKFVISKAELEEVARNTTEPFKGLWLSHLPSQGILIGYGVVDNTIVIKFEDNDGERLSAEELYTDMDRMRLPSVYGSILTFHDAHRIEVIDKVVDASVHVNHPDGLYLTEYSRDGRGVVHHTLEGDVFTLQGDTYVALSAESCKDVIERHLKYDLGMFIPDEYLVRFGKGSGWIYFPLRYVFHGDVVAVALSKFGEAELWAKKEKELTNKYYPQTVVGVVV